MLEWHNSGVDKKTGEILSFQVCKRFSATYIQYVYLPKKEYFRVCLVCMFNQDVEFPICFSKLCVNSAQVLVAGGSRLMVSSRMFTFSAFTLVLCGCCDLPRERLWMDARLDSAPCPAHEL